MKKLENWKTEKLESVSGSDSIQTGKLENCKTRLRCLVTVVRFVKHKTASMRRHDYTYTGVSLNKQPDKTYEGCVLQCVRCGQRRLLRTEDDILTAMAEYGCIGYMRLEIEDEI